MFTELSTNQFILNDCASVSVYKVSELDIDVCNDAGYKLRKEEVA